MQAPELVKEIEEFMASKRAEPTLVKGKILDRDLKNKVLIIGIEDKRDIYPGSLLLIEKKLRGFVSEIKENTIRVETKHNIKDLPEEINMDVNRINFILKNIERVKNKIKNESLNVTEKENLELLMGKARPAYSSKKFLSAGLNSCQGEAVSKSLNAKKFHLIIGPPGTGKTFVISEIAKRLNGKTLLTAGTNIAVDNMVSKISESGEDRILRIGPLNEIRKGLKKFSLNERMKKNKKWKSIERIDIEAKKIDSEIGIMEEDPKGKKEDLCFNLKRKYSEMFRLKKEIAEKLISESKIVAGTVASCGSPYLDDIMFDCLIMDEAGQVSTFNSLLAVFKAKKLVLVGDDNQLRPIEEEKLSGLNQSIFSRLFYFYPFSNTMLDTQYRMSKEIADIASELFYGGRLKTFEQIKNQRLETEGKDRLVLPERPVTFFDTCKRGWTEDYAEESRLNRRQGSFVCLLASRFADCGINSENIGIITPYKKQVEYIREKISDKKIEVETIHRFQGREKEVIILDLVRSLKRPELKDVSWFDKEKAKINVGITRARKKLVIVGDSSTLEKSSFLSRFMDLVGKENRIVL